MKERNSKKKMWLSLGLAGALTVGATLALFTGVTGTLTNEFSIYSGADGNGVKLEIKEHNVAFEDEELEKNDYKYETGDPWIDGSKNSTKAGVVYKDLVSYQVIDKDPTVFMHNGSLKSMVVLEVDGLKQNNIKTFKQADDTNIGDDGLSTEWTKIEVTADNLDTDKTYFIYTYKPDTDFENAVPAVANYNKLPAIFKHLQVQDVKDNDKFTEITARAAAAQLENTNEKTAVLEALKTLDVNATNYTVVQQQ